MQGGPGASRRGSAREAGGTRPPRHTGRGRRPCPGRSYNPGSAPPAAVLALPGQLPSLLSPMTVQMNLAARLDAAQVTRALRKYLADAPLVWAIGRGD